MDKWKKLIHEYIDKWKYVKNTVLHYQNYNIVWNDVYIRKITLNKKSCFL